MTQENILKCKELERELNILVEKYYNEYLKDPFEEFYNWKWSQENPNEIIIVYSFLNRDDEWEEDEYHVTIEELSNFKPNNY